MTLPSSQRYPLAQAKSARKYKAKIKAIIVEAKGVPCADCAVRYPTCVMDFDHRIPAEKLGNIGSGAGWGEARLRAEIAKCDVVCSNCHRLRTHCPNGLTPPPV